jgi:Ni/Co efflux regulator RcnB
MPSPLSTRRLIALLLSAAVAAPAFAAPPEGAGNGKGKDKHEKHEKHEKKEKKEKKDKGDKLSKVGEGDHLARKPLQQGAYFNDRNREAVHAYYGKRCPPGLAKKNNGCLPPGQAKKWQIGEPLPTTVVWTPPPQDVVVLLPRVPPGHQYVQIAGDILLIAVGSKMVVDGIEGLMSR